MNLTFEKAREFIYRNARPLDLARWQYHFEQGKKEAVLEALSFYQNEDGGFGHALEPDVWNPNSSPIQTWAATEIVNELHSIDSKHPLIQGIFRYLESGKDFVNHQWLNTVPTNNEHPHASWWECKDEIGTPSCNPTVALAGFIIRYATENSELYHKGCKIASEALTAFMSPELLEDMHEVSCYIRLFEYLKEAKKTDLVDLTALEARLKEQVKHCITLETSQWDVAYVCKPSQFFHSKHSIFYEENKEIAEYECEFIINHQRKDGSYPVTWQWGTDYKEFEISKNWWKSGIVIINMLYLKGLQRL